MKEKAVITFLSLDGIHGRIEPDSGRVFYTEKGNKYRRDICCVLPDGSAVVKDYGRYDLREDLARRLRPRFFRYGNTHAAELFTGGDKDSFQIQSVLPVEDGQRFLLSVSYTGGKNALISVNPAGEERETIFETDAYPYGFSMNREKTKIAFHIAGGDGIYNPCGVYAINVMNTDGSGRKLVRAEKDHLYFAPVWSPDGQFLAYLDCNAREDPAHYYANLCVSRPDGSDFHIVTEGSRHYFGTSFGLPGYRGGGSNCTIWTGDGRLIYTRMAEGSHPDCIFDPGQRSHEENIYAPEQSRGGSQLCFLNPSDGTTEEITPYEEHKWDFRASLTPDKERLIYTSVRDGEASAVRMLCLKDPGSDVLLTKGHDNRGADHASYHLLGTSLYDYIFAEKEFQPVI